MKYHVINPHTQTCDLCGEFSVSHQYECPYGIEIASPANAKQIGGDHYMNLAVEPWDVVDCWPIEQRIGYYRGNALKYVMRLGSKDAGAQEARKAAHYLEKLAEVLEQ